MKTTGIVRNTDPLGRIVIPKELRRGMEINVGDPVEILVEEDVIMLRKSQAAGACLVTGEVLAENKEFAPGLTLSLEGARVLLHELQNKKAKVNT
ncbi:AbrB/MazE/SpoVT family DNA-binding domain-containing protein [Planococcus halocryophilus]|uniref:AbrB/MazE/SpoVT family DNA-binding domain-containing protein n=1 Tax=Planococcus halocryophilus TaxID=1215089 RepID=UPI001F10420C|nr:AbrB/MazE/SpoVT family DNA-binding domain-containing protein [Planococcus halocryophilus]MCH4825393.1 AbrB/MazE/SpoVT family DNA-binding domain-containing protein [Planococcus halocryophilus]